MTTQQQTIVPWMRYLTTTLQTVFAFYLATIAFGIFITHPGSATLLSGLLMTCLYLAVIGLCIALIVQRFSLAALMIIVPVAPLLALFSVVSLIPLLEKLG